MSKPTIPQGTRDFNADVIRKRSYILNTIRRVFELYGFEPLETPAMENIETLMGKYGDEGDKLIFKILNNGLDRPEKAEKARNDFENILNGKTEKNITERALRYDLTIPFARYVAMNHNNLVLPFKRYQIQPVWRADRPQRGRYREFLQCDADVVGSTSLLNDAELCCIYGEVFSRLKLDVNILINSRKILTGLAESIGMYDKLTDITVAIDKLDKIGIEKVMGELRSRNLNEAQIKSIQAFLNINGNNTESLSTLKNHINNEQVLSGINDLENILRLISKTPYSNSVKIDFTLARGLNYYTGVIYEVKTNAVKMGSIGGGGRYDDLTGLFGVKNVPGVGISFGVDRIYDVLDELNLFPDNTGTTTRILFFNLGEKESEKAFELMQQLRMNNIEAELYPDSSKMDKQFKYAEKKLIPIVIIIGTNELNEGRATVRNILSGKQELVDFNALPQHQF